MLQAVSGRGGAAGRGDTRWQKMQWRHGRSVKTASASNSQRSADGVQRASGSSAHSYRAASSLKRWACRSTLGMQACVSGQKTRSFRRLTAPPCSSIVVAGRARRHELSRALVQQSARESPPVWPISSAARHAGRHVDVGRRWRGQRNQPIAVRLRDLLGVFSAFSRRGPPSDPDIAPSKRCSHHERYTRLHGRPVTAAPICSACCVRLTSLALPSLSSALAFPGARQPFVLRRSIKMRPALTAGPPNLSVGSRQLLRALLSSCVTKRGPEFTPETHPRAISTKSQSTHDKTQQSSLTAVLLLAAGLAGPASVIKPTQQR